MRRYLTYPLVFDLGICLLLTVLSILFKDQLKGMFNVPTSSGLDKLTNGLITVGATLMGFLLTIITVIVTFKKGFEDDKKKAVSKQHANPDSQESSNALEGVQETVFETTISKEEQFYNSDLHKRVGLIFTNATYECGVVLLLLLLLQFEILNIRIFYTTLLVVLAFISLTLAIARSLYIFKYFLRVHLHDMEDSSSKTK